MARHQVPTVALVVVRTSNARYRSSGRGLIAIRICIDTSFPKVMPYTPRNVGHARHTRRDLYSGGTGCLVPGGSRRGEACLQSSRFSLKTSSDPPCGPPTGSRPQNELASVVRHAGTSPWWASGPPAPPGCSMARHIASAVVDHAKFHTDKGDECPGARCLR